MANTISTAHVRQYKANVDILSQQKGSKCQMCVRNESQTGKYGFYDQISKITALTNPTTRHADTVIIDTPHSRRRVGLAYYTFAELVDTADKVQMLVDPTSKYAVNAAYAFGRTKDSVILTAASGIAYTGEEGATATTFDNSMIVTASGGSYSGSTVGLNMDKLRGASLLLNANDVDMEGRYFVAHPEQQNDLLGLSELTSRDYNTIRTLVDGEIDTFMGFKFIWTTEVQKVGDDYLCYAWHRDAMLLALGKDDLGFNAKVSERNDKNHSTQIFNEMMIGAVRMDENAIVQVKCQVA